MADIISFEKGREKRVSSETNDLNDLMKRASLICRKRLDFSKNELNVIKEGRLKNIFEGKITQEIFTRKLIGSDVFLCGIYVSNLLAKLTLTIPESWWAIDYNSSNDSSALKKGGDTCFILCGVFPERGNRRLMDITYYQKMGVGFYYQFYSLAKKEIGYHMSHQFQAMVAVVQSCIHNF
jgi:hypothetical protein